MSETLIDRAFDAGIEFAEWLEGRHDAMREFMCGVPVDLPDCKAYQLEAERCHSIIDKEAAIKRMELLATIKAEA